MSLNFLVYNTLGAGGLGSESRVGRSKIGHSVANGSPPLRCFFGAALPRRQGVEMDSSICYALRRNTASQRHGLAVPRAGDRSYVMGSIHGWSLSHLTYITGGC